MITLLRVDDRLLHGQVAFSWVRNLRIHRIIIGDDRIVYDEFSKMTLGLSKPSGVDLKIYDIKEVITYLKEHVYDDIHIMAIVNNVENAYQIMSEIPEINRLNLGVLRERYDSSPISDDVSLTKSEITLCNELIDLGKDIELRVRYEDKSINLMSLLKQK